MCETLASSALPFGSESWTMRTYDKRLILIEMLFAGTNCGIIHMGPQEKIINYERH
jgi:hypothetical protein